MRALVLGGSGHLGNAVVRELLARGHAVTAARRGRGDARNLAGLAVTGALGDADDAATLDGWIAGHDLVVDAAAPYPLRAEPGAAAASARRAAGLVDAIARHGARLVHVSSFATQLANCDPHAYFAAKRAGEAVFAAAIRAGAPIAIVRPTNCMGPWDCRPSVLCLVPRVLAGWMPVMPSHVINVIDVRDVARGVVALAAAPGVASVLLSGHDVGLPELCGLIGELAGIRVTTQVVPAGLVRAAAWAIELATLGTVVPPVLLPTLLALRHTPLPVRAAQRALGAAPRPLSVTLRDAIAWHRGSDPRVAASQLPVI
jgi:dihydroflavonol-4-reductase